MTTILGIGAGAVGMNVAVRARKEAEDRKREECKSIYDNSCDALCTETQTLGTKPISFWAQENTLAEVNICNGKNGDPYTSVGMSEMSFVIILLGCSVFILFLSILSGILKLLRRCSPLL